MAFKIGNNTVIDDDRNGYFNIGNIKSYNSNELSNLSPTVGQVAYCTDCSQELVWFNGTKWQGGPELQP